MRRLVILTPAFALVAACGNTPGKQEGKLIERAASADKSDRGANGDSVPSQ